MPISVTEFTDPGCIWSWGSEPQLRWLRHHYGDQLAWEQVLGVQLRDAEEAFGDRPAEAFRADWLEVAEHTGSPVPERLAWRQRSTRPACTAVHAARVQGDAVAAAVLRALRESFFVSGRPADDGARIVAAVTGVAGLDVVQLLDDLVDPAIVARARADEERTRDPHPAVIGRTGPGPNPGAAKPDGDRLRYGFPTLIIRGPGGEHVVSGWRSTAELEAAVVAAGAVAVDAAGSAPLDADAALERHRTLTVRELELLTGNVAPTDAIRVATATAPIWVHPAEAARLAPAGLTPVS